MANNGLLEISNLSKRFGGLIAVNDLDLSIKRGELVSIIGPNGSGKSTLFNLITGIYNPSNGFIKFDGKDITRFKPYQVARCGIGRTFQDTMIYRQIKVIDNVIIGQRLHTKTGVLGAIFKPPITRREEYRTRIKSEEILTLVGLSEISNEIAGNLNQEAQKRLSIAIALATEPKLLLLDEPTGGVNLEEIGGLIELLERIRNSGITICLIEHKMRMVMNISDHIIVLNYGKKIAAGMPKEVVRNEEVIRAYLGARNDAQAE